MNRFKNFFLIGSLFLFLSSCISLNNPQIDTGSQKEFNDNYQKWQSKNILHYRYNLDIGSFATLIDSDKMPVTIEVGNGDILSITDVAGAIPDPDFRRNIENYVPFEKIFDLVKKAVSEADRFHIEYDLNYGFPKSVSIDWEENMADEDIGLTISNFEILP